MACRSTSCSAIWGHQRPEVTARYAATLAATAEAEFLKPSTPAVFNDTCRPASNLA